MTKTEEQDTDMASDVQAPVETFSVNKSSALESPTSSSEYITLATYLWKKCRFDEAEEVLHLGMEHFPEEGDMRKLYDSIRADRSTLFEIKQSKKGNIAFKIESLSKNIVAKQAAVKFDLVGWVATTVPSSRIIIAQKDGKVTIHDILRTRGDVVSYFKKTGLQVPVEKCGFTFTADISQPCTISLVNSKGVSVLCELTPTKVVQVLEGTKGWLFLDKDTNRASDIFTGKKI